MEVRFTRDRRLPGHRYSLGDEAELPDGLAEALVNDGYAEPVKAKRHRANRSGDEGKSSGDPGAEKR